MKSWILLRNLFGTQWKLEKWSFNM